VTEYAYLGSAPATYPQYLAVLPDGGTAPLSAEPGGTYAMQPVPGWEGAKGASILPVPPGDGRWAVVSGRKSAAHAAPATKPKGA
jgi:hypothetical protein